MPKSKMTKQKVYDSNKVPVNNGKYTLYKGIKYYENVDSFPNTVFQLPTDEQKREKAKKKVNVIKRDIVMLNIRLKEIELQLIECYSK